MQLEPTVTAADEGSSSDETDDFSTPFDEALAILAEADAKIHEMEAAWAAEDALEAEKQAQKRQQREQEALLESEELLRQQEEHLRHQEIELKLKLARVGKHRAQVRAARKRACGSMAVPSRSFFDLLSR